MPTSMKVRDFANTNANFRKVLAGQMTVQDFFTNPGYTMSKNEFMKVYNETFTGRQDKTFYPPENVAAAWIAKLRYNENMTDDQFIQQINRSEEIFKGNVTELGLKVNNQADNDICTIMWGIEALNGIQSFDSGATRVRLPTGVAPRIVQALEQGGSKPRESTHATGTKLVDNGLGKDLENEKLREFTPRGMGALLIIPTSQDGKGSAAKVSETTSNTVSAAVQNRDYDLLLKREDYGYKDTNLHSLVHSKVGFLNSVTDRSTQYQEGKSLINSTSKLAKAAEKEFGKGKQIHRKEHLSELKEQSATLIDLLEAGKKQGLFKDFETTWTIRIKWPPFEKKIVSSDPNGRKALGDFLKQLAAVEKVNSQFAIANKDKLDEVRDLLSQAEKSDPFEQCREGNEILVNCQSGSAKLVANIAKSTKNDPVNRESLVAAGVVSEMDPAAAFAHQQSIRDGFRNLHAAQQCNDAEPEPESERFDL